MQNKFFSVITYNSCNSSFLHHPIFFLSLERKVKKICVLFWRRMSENRMALLLTYKTWRLILKINASSQKASPPHTWTLRCPRLASLAQIGSGASNTVRVNAFLLHRFRAVKHILILFVRSIYHTIPHRLLTNQDLLI